MLVRAVTIVATDNAGVGRRSLRPVDPAVLELELLGGMVAGWQPRDERSDGAGLGIHDHDA